MHGEESRARGLEGSRGSGTSCTPAPWSSRSASCTPSSAPCSPRRSRARAGRTPTPAPPSREVPPAQLSPRLKGRCAPSPRCRPLSLSPRGGLAPRAAGRQRLPPPSRLCERAAASRPALTAGRVNSALLRRREPKPPRPRLAQQRIVRAVVAAEPAVRRTVPAGHVREVSWTGPGQVRARRTPPRTSCAPSPRRAASGCGSPRPASE